MVPPPPSTTRDGATVRALRFGLLAVFLIGEVGSLTELLLLGHTEDVWQLIPLFLIGAGVLALGWFRFAPGRTSHRVFQAVMVLSVASGLMGALLHYRGNVEFELEMYPSLSGLSLFWEALHGATPALAPGTMIELGLVGLAYAFRHPAGATPSPNRSGGIVT